MSKTKKQALSIVILIAFILIAIGYVVGFTGLKATGSKDDTMMIEVQEGESYQTLIQTLKDEGFIKNEIAAKVYLKLNPPTNLQANTYLLNKSMDFKDIVSVVENGSSEYIVNAKLTIPEGYTIRDIMPLVADLCEVDESEVDALWHDEAYLKTLIDHYWFLTDDILKEGILYPLEGYLYPQTYIFNDGVDLKTVTEKILDLTDEMLSPYKDKIEASGFTIHQFMTFSSIVERESLFEVDYPKIAGVFMNRLNEGMKLQSDITVLYALNRTGVDVSYDDLEIDSPYNTYMYEGLPMGPISSVSTPIIDACLSYENHDYLYFYACPDGTVLYASTLDQHQENIEANPW